MLEFHREEDAVYRKRRPNPQSISVIQAYQSVIVSMPEGDVVSAKLLPYPKAVIKTAISAMMKREGEPNVMVCALVNQMLTLSRFQYMTNEEEHLCTGKIEELADPLTHNSSAQEFQQRQALVDRSKAVASRLNVLSLREETALKAEVAAIIGGFKGYN